MTSVIIILLDVQIALWLMRFGHLFSGLDHGLLF
jgi:hypothetical protein